MGVKKVGTKAERERDREDITQYKVGPLRVTGECNGFMGLLLQCNYKNVKVVMEISIWLKFLPTTLSYHRCIFSHCI